MTARSGMVSWSSRKRGAMLANRSVDVAFARISQLASAIESDPFRIEEWYRFVHIRELGGMTAQELVMQDCADMVIDFLHSIRRGERE